MFVFLRFFRSLFVLVALCTRGAWSAGGYIRRVPACVSSFIVNGYCERAMCWDAKRYQVQ